MWHPAAYCPSKAFCCCVNFNSQITCCMVAAVIISNGFAACNYGISCFSLFVLSISNELLLISAGTILMLGSIWKKNRLKVASCWILFISILTSIAACILYISKAEKAYIIWDEMKKPYYPTIIVICNTAYVVICNLYFPMVVYGNMDDDV